MSKPVLTLDPISSTLQDWAKVVDINFARIKAVIGGQVGSSPVPITGYSTTLPGAVVSEQCIAVLGTLSAQRLQLSDGSVWHPIPIQGSAVSALTDNTGGTASGTLAAMPDPANSPATADALRDDIVANVLPVLRNWFASMSAKLNELRTALRNGGALP